MADLNLEPVPENPAKKKQIAFIVAAVAILAIGATLFSHNWLSAGGEIEGGLGLRGYEICFMGQCQSQSNKALIDDFNEGEKRKAEMLGGKADTKSPAFWIAGYLTLVAGFGTILSLGLAIAMVAQGKWWAKPMPPTSAAFLFLFLGLAGAVVFLVTNPTSGTAFQLGTGWAFWVFGLGTVVGIAATQMLAKFKPAEPELTY